MKPIRLITGMLAAAAVMMASCSAPRLAQQNMGNDDVYNSVAQAQEYVQPKPSEASEYRDDVQYDDEYGSSDPYYDMNYSSRINRFYYGSPFRSYFDPFYYDYYGYNSIYGYNYLSPWYSPGFSMGFGWGWGNYGWGAFSPYYAWNPYYGGGYLGGFYGGGYYGGGYYGGGYANNLRGNTTYGPRPNRGRENGIGRTGAVRSTNGVISSSGSRSERYNPNRGAPMNTTTRSGTNRSSDTYRRPATRSNTPNRPSYTPPSSNRNDGGATRSSGNTGGGGGASRSQRGGGRN